jgi:hypothetical protein
MRHIPIHGLVLPEVIPVGSLITKLVNTTNLYARVPTCYMPNTRIIFSIITKGVEACPSNDFTRF